VKWIEVELTVNLPTLAKNVILFNYKNMPYQITAGVDLELYTYAGGE
jgi:hypothetical protein